jgi:hypothetical protein
MMPPKPKKKKPTKPKKKKPTKAEKKAKAKRVARGRGLKLSDANVLEALFDADNPVTALIDWHNEKAKEG